MNMISTDDPVNVDPGLFAERTEFLCIKDGRGEERQKKKKKKKKKDKKRWGVSCFTYMCRCRVEMEVG